MKVQYDLHIRPYDQPYHRRCTASAVDGVKLATGHLNFASHGNRAIETSNKMQQTRKIGTWNI